MFSSIYPLLDYVKQPICKKGQMLIKKHFPGALTVILEKSKETPDYLTSGMPTVGIRVPNNETFAELCKNIESRVLATTSANISGEPPALSYEEALNYVGESVDYVLPSGSCEAQGIASTVAGFDGDNVIIYRQGEVLI